MPGALFWTYFVGAGLLAAAISLIAWRYVRWSATLLALLFLIIVATIDLPNLRNTHRSVLLDSDDARSAFAGGRWCWRKPLAGRRWAGTALETVGRLIAAVRSCSMRSSISLPAVRARGSVGEVDAGLGASADGAFVSCWGNLAGRRSWVMIPRTRRAAAAGAGTVLLLLTIFFYVPILVMEIQTPLGVEA